MCINLYVSPQHWLAYWMSRRRVVGLEPSLIIGIDVGTTYSGVSYWWGVMFSGYMRNHHGLFTSIPRLGKSQILGVTKWINLRSPSKIWSQQNTHIWHRYPAQETVGGDLKVPTIIWYDQAGRFKAAGAEAKRDATVAKAEEEKWVKAEWCVTSEKILKPCTQTRRICNQVQGLFSSKGDGCSRRTSHHTASSSRKIRSRSLLWFSSLSFQLHEEIYPDEPPKRQSIMGEPRRRNSLCIDPPQQLRGPSTDAYAPSGSYGRLGGRRPRSSIQSFSCYWGGGLFALLRPEWPVTRPSQGKDTLLPYLIVTKRIPIEWTRCHDYRRRWRNRWFQFVCSEWRRVLRDCSCRMWVLDLSMYRKVSVFRRCLFWVCVCDK